MPFPISCPGCQRQLNVPDAMNGRRAKCPGCATTFEAKPPAPAAPPPEPSDDNPFGAIGQESGSPFEQFDAKAASQAPVVGDSVSWGRTRVGLTILLIGVYTSLGSMGSALVGGALVVVLAVTGIGRELGNLDGPLALLFGGGLALLGLASMVSYVAGMGFCLCAPNERAARVLVGIALGLTVGSLIGSMCALLFLPLVLIVGLSAIAAKVLLVLFLRATALNLDNRKAARSAISILYGLGILVGVGILVIFLVLVAIFIGRDNPPLARAIAGLAGLLQLGLYVMLGILLFGLMKTLSQIRVSVDRFLLAARG